MRTECRRRRASEIRIDDRFVIGVLWQDAAAPNLFENAAMVILGDFVFCAGNPCKELVKFKPESCRQDFIIRVSQNAKWADLIEKCYGDKAKKVTRYVIKKKRIYLMWRN